MAGFKGGFGGGNMQAMMKQAQMMRKSLPTLKRSWKKWKSRARAAAAWSRSCATAKKVISSISIDPKAVDPDDVEMLEDLIVAAINDAYSVADEEYEDKMGMFGGMI